MLGRYHIAITYQAIGAEFSPRAFKVIIRANLGQDSLRYQIGHDHFHFDNNQLEASYAFVEAQRAEVVSSLTRGETQPAWQAFGRMLHTLQDFYSHSDYIPRWLSRFAGETPPPPEEVDPVSSEILNHPGLHSGKIYQPLDALVFIPFLRKLLLHRLPADSHGRMNHDSPKNSAQFDYVFHASVKRTRIEFDKTAALLSAELLEKFVDR
jgi:hypothetical protein